jgi:hypothetical protein
MKNKSFLGHVDFFWNSLDITNKNIFYYLKSKYTKIYIHLNKCLSKCLNLNHLIIFYTSIFYLILCFKNFGQKNSIFGDSFKMKKIPHNLF